MLLNPPILIHRFDPEPTNTPAVKRLFKEFCCVGLNGTGPVRSAGRRAGCARLCVTSRVAVKRSGSLWNAPEARQSAPRERDKSLARSCVGVGAFVGGNVLLGDKHLTANTSHCCWSAAFVVGWNKRTKRGPLSKLLLFFLRLIVCCFLFGTIFRLVRRPLWAGSRESLQTTQRLIGRFDYVRFSLFSRAPNHSLHSFRTNLWVFIFYRMTFLKSVCLLAKYLTNHWTFLN